MKGLGLPIAAGALLALAALGAVSLLRPAAPVSQADQVAQVAAELRCPDCAGLSVADSSSQTAAAIRAQIATLIAAGRTPEEARQAFVDRYGEWILLSPTSALAWLVPFAAVVAGMAVLVAWLWWGRRRPIAGAGAVVGGRAAEVSDADRARAREEAEALDA
jgi:cytochrome c-type biogenesis protein CcmH